MKYEIVATPADNIYMGPCIMIAALMSSDKEVLLLVKTENSPFAICKRNEKIFFEEGDFRYTSGIPLRISDACVTGTLGDTACSCHVDSVEYLEMMQKNSVGIFLYLPHEGMGRGLLAKLLDHRLQLGLGVDGQNAHPMSFEESAKVLFGDSSYDSRVYKDVGELFKQLGLDVLPFLYFGENVRKMEKIRMETGLHLIIPPEDTHE